MLGGSWAQVGGHNPYEALALGCHVLHGPHIDHFSESYADLATQGLTQELHTVDELAEAIVAQWQSTRRRAPHGSQSSVDALESLLQLGKFKAP
jgi:3-deoxy-D-manno-octulosonic-acid transferase